jgi:hypothetical protein
LPFCGALAVRMIRRRPLSGTGLIEALFPISGAGNQIPPNERPMPNLYFAPADVGGDPSPSSARDGRRRIILTASAPQNGKALPHDPDPNRVVAPPASRSDRR